MGIREFSINMEREMSIWCARSRYEFGVEHIVFVEKSSGIFGLGQLQTLRITITFTITVALKHVKPDLYQVRQCELHSLEILQFSMLTP